MNIFVGSLPYSLKESKLQEIFEEYGEVSSVKIITDKFSGKSKGFGFVEMPDDEDALTAIEELDGYEVEGRSIVVNKSEEKKENRRGGGNFGGGGGYNRGGGGGFNRGGGGGGNRRGGNDRRGGGNRRDEY